jgi:hypothetical protein
MLQEEVFRMATDVVGTLRRALAELRIEKTRVDRHISVMATALGALNGQRPVGGPPQRRRRMSPDARKAIGQRMKAYWAKRRAATAKGKAKRAR